VFGCVAWDHIFYDFRKKLDAKSHDCIMMGYFEESIYLIGYLILSNGKSLSDEMYGLMRSFMASSC
jgi:hypothetical protein